MKKTILLGLVSSSLLFSQASNAGEWGIGGLVGQVNADDICTGLQGCDDSDTTFGINVSYNFNKVWGAELGYVDLGDYSGSADLGFFGTFDVSADLSAAYLAGTGTYNFNDAWSLTGRLGFASANIDVRVSGAGSDDDSDTGGYGGVSLNYNFNQNLQAQLRYDNFDGDFDTFALGLKYNFGR